MKNCFWILTCIFCCGTVLADMALTEKGTARYHVRLAENASDTDRLALKELQEAYLALTGCALPEKHGGGPAIFIGKRPDGERKLADGEHVTKNIGEDIYLYGEGRQGNLYAVYAFIEDRLGGRYYSVDEGLFIRKDPAKKLKPFERYYRYPFEYRKLGMAVPRFDERFFYRNRDNGMLRNAFGIGRDVAYLSPTAHSFYYFIPPGGNKVVGSNPDPRKRGYFAEHPEFFSMDKNGKRVKTQLCFGNRELRRELIRNIDAEIREKLPAAAGFRKKILDFSANDMGGAFCCCPECVALEKKYGCPGGPLFECLAEICNTFQEKYPDVTFSTLLYRREQTQKPPQGLVFPSNFEGVFAPINDNFLGSLSDECNAQTRKDLEKWCSIARISIWYYPSHYSTAFHTAIGYPPPPLGHAERIAADVRLFASLGITSIYFEHDSGTACNANFTDMIGYLCYKLMQNPGLDIGKLISGYMRDNYEAAAPLMLNYYRELEAIRKKLLAGGMWFNYMPYTGQYASSMTPANLVRWDRQFDEMEKLAAKDEKVIRRIRQARLSIDLAVFADFRKVAEMYPEYAEKRKELKSRILDTVERANALRIPDGRYSGSRLNIRPLLDEMEREPKPLPQEFASIPAERVIQVSPDYPRRLPVSRKVMDQDAAWGVAGAEEIPAGKTTFTIGFYDYWNKRTQTSLKVDLSSVKPGYQFYKIGTVRPTQNCLFFTDQWRVTIYADHIYSFDEPELEYEAYMSLKFPAEDSGDRRVLCDRVVLVKKK